MPVNEQIESLKDDIEDLLNEYPRLHNEQIEWGEIGYGLYGDYFEIANYHLASLKNCLDMLHIHFYRESFSSLRGVFENYLCFQLMTEGKRYFRLFKKNEGEPIDKAVERFNEDIKRHKSKNRSNLLVKARQFKKEKLIEVIYEGPYVDGKRGKGNLVPMYWDLYKQFHPDSAFLDYKGYLSLYPHLPQFTKQQVEHKKGHASMWRYYLRFEGMLHSLRLNRLSSKEKNKRIRAHYVFLSQFVHPSYASIETLKNKNSVKFDIQNLKDINEDNPTLRLLGLCYVGYLVCGIIESLLRVIDNAPKKYVADPQTTQIWDKINMFYKKHDYFWFIHNGPHQYDRFQCCIARVGSKRKVVMPADLEDRQVPFERDVLKRINNLQIGWSNKICGSYTPPF